MKIASIALALLLLIPAASAASLNLNGGEPVHQDMIKIGVYIDTDYYVVTKSQDRILKIEYNAPDEVAFTVKTTFEDAMQFASEYPAMSWVQKAGWLVSKFGVPAEFIIDFEKIMGGAS